MYWIIDHVAWMTERHWPLCVAVMAAMLLLAAYVEGGTVMVP